MADPARWPEIARGRRGPQPDVGFHLRVAPPRVETGVRNIGGGVRSRRLAGSPHSLEGFDSQRQAPVIRSAPGAPFIHAAPYDPVPHMWRPRTRYQKIWPAPGA